MPKKSETEIKPLYNQRLVSKFSELENKAKEFNNFYAEISPLSVRSKPVTKDNSPEYRKILEIIG